VDANAIYYTLSTIAQTLAGSLAVLVAFVLLQLSRIEDAIIQGRADLQSRYTAWEKMWDTLRVDGLAGLDKVSSGRIDQPRLRAAYHEAHIGWRIRPQIIRRLQVALGFTITDIALCFVALPFTPHIARSPWIAWTILGLAVLLGLISLGLYIWLIAAMVKRPTE
jgi:hypothetical protein